MTSLLSNIYNGIWSYGSYYGAKGNGSEITSENGSSSPGKMVLKKGRDISALPKPVPGFVLTMALSSTVACIGIGPICLALIPSTKAEKVAGVVFGLIGLAIIDLEESSKLCRHLIVIQNSEDSITKKFGQVAFLAFDTFMRAYTLTVFGIGVGAVTSGFVTLLTPKNWLLRKPGAFLFSG